MDNDPPLACAVSITMSLTRKQPQQISETASAPQGLTNKAMRTVVCMQITVTLKGRSEHTAC